MRLILFPAKNPVFTEDFLISMVVSSRDMGREGY